MKMIVLSFSAGWFLAEGYISIGDRRYLRAFVTLSLSLGLMYILVMEL
jgi:hypothetical protein